MPTKIAYWPKRAMTLTGRLIWRSLEWLCWMLVCLVAMCVLVWAVLSDAFQEKPVEPPKPMANKPSNDPVNHPKHYTNHPSGVECIQITEHMGFNLGNAVKYIWRCDLKKDAVEDLKKARFYIEREIALRERRRQPSGLSE